MKLKIFICLALISIFILNGCKIKKSNSGPEKSDSKLNLVVDLSGEWKFSIGDEIDWKSTSFDDKNWESISVPSSWEDQGFYCYDGFAWYRKEFNFSINNTDNNFYLVLGYVDDVDQTYLNGHLLGVSGGFPPAYRTAYNAFRKYYIPKEYLNLDGKNLLSVRVFDAELDGGILSGKVGIITFNNFTDPDINLEGVWKFNLGDDQLWSNKEFDDTEWDNLMVPAHWEIQGYPDYDGFAWYRKSFNLPSKLKSENFLLLLGQVDDIDEVYFNGTLIGSTGMWNFDKTPASFNERNEWQQKRVYSIPAKLLDKNGNNVIAVRIYDGFKDGGIYSGPIGLITQNNYRKTYLK